MSLVSVLTGLFAPGGAFAWPYSISPVGLLLPVFLSTITIGWVEFNKAVQPSELLTPLSFDFIVIGAGSAGMVVATRIANNTKGYKVLLLEAGGDPSPANFIPLLDASLCTQPPNNWIYDSVVQNTSCLNCDNQRVHTSRGKMMGGSSGTNFMMYVRGHRKDYDLWGNVTGDPRWIYDNVLPYFKKSQNYDGFWPFDPEYHGRDGLLDVSTYDYQPGTSQLVDAARERGHPSGDYNGADQAVFSPIDVTTKDGKRESTYRAYYLDTGKSPNLTIKKYAYVTKINFEGNKAVSVTYERQGFTKTVQANKEIILSAGAFNSPQILMLSGIGPADHLQSLNIPVVQDLPVGRNLQDQPFLFAGVYVKSPGLNQDTDVGPVEGFEYVTNGTGPLAAPAGHAGVGFFQSPNAYLSYPNLQVVQESLTYSDDMAENIHAITGLNKALLQQYLQGYDGKDLRFPGCLLNRPWSEGWINLSSTNPHDPPLWDARYLSDERDVDALLYGFKVILDIYENSTALNTPLIPRAVPGCEEPAFVFRSDEYFKCVIRHMSVSRYHHARTCPMGKVVDSTLKVYNIQSLRVVDASVMPTLPNGNINVPTIMIAEVASDLIKSDWNM